MHCDCGAFVRRDLHKTTSCCMQCAYHYAEDQGQLPPLPIRLMPRSAPRPLVSQELHAHKNCISCLVVDRRMTPRKPLSKLHVHSQAWQTRGHIFGGDFKHAALDFGAIGSVNSAAGMMLRRGNTFVTCLCDTFLTKCLCWFHTAPRITIVPIAWHVCSNIKRGRRTRAHQVVVGVAPSISHPPLLSVQDSSQPIPKARPRSFTAEQGANFKKRVIAK